jgi:enoyl-CoA hydratase/carnithine racemase
MKEQGLMSLADEIIATDDVAFHVENGAGIITLQRPQALNALSFLMMKAIRRQLLRWAVDPQVQIILVRSTCARAFCAGGDLRGVYETGQRQDFALLEQLFREEYALNHLIHCYPKPYIALINGIAMGGGIGLSVHGSHRLLSEHCLIAMPETNIGYFPDVGATYFLNQAPGRLGLYLGLTGNHINTADALYANIGTHFVAAAKQDILFQALINLEPKTDANVDSLIAEYATPYEPAGLQAYQDEIDMVFTADSLPQILENLKRSSSSFAQTTLKTLLQRSPTSLYVTFAQLKAGQTLGDFKDIMALEFMLSQHFIHGHDFFEGIRSTIIDKDKTPQWHPDHVDHVKPSEIARYFTAVTAPLEVDVLDPQR